MLDLVIKGGSVIDGTGAPAKRADVGVRDGRIVEIGDINEKASTTLDAEGRVVTPGFVDLHTHYDPQVMWDPAATPSSLHGVTSIFGGNCGFSIAPITPAAADYLLPMLARVEGMPVEALEAGLDLAWDGFGSWLGRLDGKLAVNAGFMVGHSALRRVVMGEDAIGHEASPQQLEAMVALLHESIAAGGIGFSSTASGSHSDHLGNPVPSRFATREEFLALAKAAGEHAGTSLEFIAAAAAIFTDDEIALMADMSAIAKRSLNWNVMVVSADESMRAGRENKLSASDVAAERGGHVVGLLLPEPMRMRLCFAAGFVLDMLPGIKDFIHLPHPERLAAFADPNVRAQIAQALPPGQTSNMLMNFADYTVVDVQNSELQRYVGMRISAIAAEQNKDAMTAMFDLIVADDLQTGFEPLAIGTDDASWEERVRLLETEPRVIAGGSDAGAHLDMMKTFACHTSFMAETVRKRQLISLERAVRLFTDVPARFYGLKDRGRVQTGWIADLAIMDPEKIGPGTITPRADLPGGGWRLYSEATGVEATIVNGTPIVLGGKVTGATPGTALRSGRDTETVAI